VQSLEFGSDGTSATKFNVELKSVTYDQKPTGIKAYLVAPRGIGKIDSLRRILDKNGPSMF